MKGRIRRLFSKQASTPKDVLALHKDVKTFVNELVANPTPEGVDLLAAMARDARRRAVKDMSYIQLATRLEGAVDAMRGVIRDRNDLPRGGQN